MIKKRGCAYFTHPLFGYYSVSFAVKTVLYAHFPYAFFIYFSLFSPCAL